LIQSPGTHLGRPTAAITDVSAAARYGGEVLVREWQCEVQLSFQASKLCHRLTDDMLRPNHDRIHPRQVPWWSRASHRSGSAKRRAGHHWTSVPVPKPYVRNMKSVYIFGRINRADFNEVFVQVIGKGQLHEDCQ